MPVVMTGSPGNGLGGAAGASFGSGLSGLTRSPPKLFTPELEVWQKRATEDASLSKERKKTYDDLRQKKLQEAADAKAKAKAKREADNAAFVARQQGLAEASSKEQKREQAARLEGLKKPTLGSPEPPWANIEQKAMVVPNSWIWATAKKYPGVAVHGLGAEHDEAMDALPRNVDKETLLSYTSSITKNSVELTNKWTEVRRQKDLDEAEAEAKLKKEREDFEIGKRDEERKARELAEKAAVQRSKQIKKEMAEETKKAARDAAEREKKRFERSQVERKDMIRHLTMDMKLRDEDEIANERREGSSMSKGGKDDFVDTAKKKGDMSSF